MHSTKISGLAVDTEYTFHLVLRTTAGTYSSEKVVVRTHKMTDLSGITITTGILPAVARENLVKAVERIGAKLTDTVRIDTTHFVTTEGRGIAWEKAVESNIPVVRPEWVAACEQNGRILGVTKFYLDAMRPGPIETSAPAPAPAPVQSPPAHKDLPPTPPPADKQANAAAQGKAATVSSESDESDGEQEEPKTSAAAEQKMRVEEKDAQKVAIRPAALSPSAESKSSSEDDGDGEGGGSGSAQAKPAVSPDGASFQEVEL